MSAGARQRRQRIRARVMSTSELLQALRDLPRAQCLCPDKLKYWSPKSVDAAIEQQWAKDRRILHPYRCGDHYHLTSHPNGKATAA